MQLTSSAKLLIVPVALLSFLPLARAAEPPIDYNRQIRPILSDKCFRCHGPDAGERASNLRLDIRDEALKPAESGRRAIVPGKPETSRLLDRIDSADPGEVMPPPETNKKLTDAERALLRRWIAEGAPYQQHWAFVTPRRPALPTVKNRAWARNPIDLFIAARLDPEGLAPSPEADRTTLIRRVTLDLTGLPPTLAEIDAFLADKRPDAYEHLVDRLLKSPNYGERMAVDWLDASRFADTHGFHIDSGRDMTLWREWVINSFNQNLPFDQFTVEQLAGDLLPGATRDQLVASGFNRNHMINFEGGAIPEEYHTAYIIDRVNTTATVWLGLTVGCAQCHDHKYDPITQKDFYGLFAFFHNVPENGLDGREGNAQPLIKVPSNDQQQKLESLAATISDLEQKLAGPDSELDAAQSEWEKSASERQLTWTVLTPSETRSRGGATLKRLEDGSILASGENPSSEVYEVSAKVGVARLTAIRAEFLPDDSLPAKGPGRSDNGNVVLTNVRVSLGGEPDSERESRPLKLWAASADFSQTGQAVAQAIDADSHTGWAIYPETGKPHTAAFEFEEPQNGVAERTLTISLEFQSAYARHQAGRFRLLVTGGRDPLSQQGPPEAILAALSVPAAERNTRQRDDLRNYFRSQVSPDGKKLNSQLAEARKERTALDKAIPTAMVMREMESPRDTFLLVRGQYDKKGDKVPAAVPGFLPGLPDGAASNRLGLAQWLVSAEHPLMSRVTVNRYWQMFFGTGLVKTSEDFGSQGELPSHPDLLDWLSTELMDSTTTNDEQRRWNLKALVRLIVTSATYRQSSVVGRDAFARDPENRLLARGPRFRLQAEFIRDQALALSGLLNRRIGGPSVSPYQPAGLWEELMSRADGKNWTAQTYEQSHGDDLYRRTMYTFWKRTCPPPTLATFDAPDRETCTIRRARTNTPLQALVLLNDPTYVEASRKLAERILTEGGKTTEDRIRFAFRTITARAPTAREIAVVKRMYDIQFAKYQGDDAASERLLKVGEAPHNTKLSAAELAAWTMVSSALLNLDEAVTRG